MNGLLMVALVCASTMAPADCSRDTALDILVQPAPTPTACLFSGEAIVAGNSFGRDRPEGSYLKIGCERRKPRS